MNSNRVLPVILAMMMVLMGDEKIRLERNASNNARVKEGWKSGK